MKVFLSWSGDLSHEVACELRDWLPKVIQAVVPYVSSEDIDKGTRWSTDIANELAESSFGILCVTRDSLAAPWLNFEAGALSKTLDKSRVCPFLFGVKRSEVQGPLVQFQSTVYEQDDVFKLVSTINSSLDSTVLEENRLTETLNVWWPRLESKLAPLLIQAQDESVEQQAETQETPDLTRLSDILEEVLELTRGQQRLLSSISTALPQKLDNVLGDNIKLMQRETLRLRRVLRPSTLDAIAGFQARSASGSLGGFTDHDFPSPSPDDESEPPITGMPG